MRHLTIAFLLVVAGWAAESAWWEYAIPAGATERSQKLPNGRIIVEYSQGGQKVGYRIYEADHQRLRLEQPMKGSRPHGMYRAWHPENDRLAMASVSRDGRLHGPHTEWRLDGSVEKTTYFVNGDEVNLARYDAARRQDSTLPPADLLVRLGQPTAPPNALDATDEQRVKAVRAALTAAETAFRAPLDLRPTLTPTNPRATTLTRVWEGAQGAKRITDPATRLVLLLECATAQRGYASRLFGFVGKTAFIDSTADILGLARGVLSALPEDRARSAGCLKLAEAWRELAKVALWGEHGNNKMACDAEAKRCYDQAVALDRTNQDAAKGRADANRPQAPRPVPPPSIAQAPAIDEARWEQAGVLRQALLDGTLGQAPPANMGLAGYDCELVVDAGKVTVKAAHESREERTIAVGESFDLRDNTDIRTDATGRARIVYYDRSVFHIRPNALVTFQDEHTLIIRLESFSSGSVVKDMIALFDSRTRRTDMRVSKRGQEFLVITPTAVLGPRGTCFAIGRGPDGEQVRVYDGAVEARTETDVAYLAPGQQAALSAQAAPRVSAIPAAESLGRAWPEAGPRAILLPGAKTPATTTPPPTPLEAGALDGAALTVYWAPQDAFTLLDAARQVPYGAAHLVARLDYAAIRRGAKLTAVWTRVGAAQPLLTQNLTAEADGRVIQSIASMPPAQVFATGDYRVRVTVAGAGWVEAQARVQAAPPLAGRQMAVVYTAGLAALDRAVQAVDAGQVDQAEAAARAALPDLRTALAEAPELPDVRCALELTEAIRALAELNRAAQAQQRPAAAAWAQRAVSHARYAAAHAATEPLRKAGQSMANQIEAILPKLRA